MMEQPTSQTEPGVSRSILAWMLFPLALFPLVALLTSILIGWVVKPQWIVEELEKGGAPFRSKKIFAFMIRYVCPIVMVILFIQSTGIL